MLPKNEKITTSFSMLGHTTQPLAQEVATQHEEQVARILARQERMRKGITKPLEPLEQIPVTKVGLAKEKADAKFYNKEWSPLDAY